MKQYLYAQQIVCKKCKISYKPTTKICRKCKQNNFRPRKKIKK